MAVRDDEPDGCIIACFGEPGLREARRRFDFPIVGMAEASMLTAMQLGGDFAILTLASIGRRCCTIWSSCMACRTAASASSESTEPLSN